METSAETHILMTNNTDDIQMKPHVKHRVGWGGGGGVIPKSLPVLSTEPVLRKAAVDRGLRFSTEQYGCRQRNDFIKCAESVMLVYFSTCFGFKPLPK